MYILIKKIKKIIDETKIVELQIFKVILAVLFIIPFTWGVSQAENIIFSEDIESATTNFSLIGIVSEIKYNKIIIEQATGSDNENKNIYVLDIVHLEKVETSTYTPLTLSDINIGATVIAQGLTNGKDYFITRIVSFASALPTPIPVDDTASSTIDIEIGSSTPETETETETESRSESEIKNEIEEELNPEATTTEATTTQDQASTTPSVVETITDVVETIIETITETIETVVDTVTGNTSSAPEESIVSEPEQEPQVEPQAEPQPESQTEPESQSIIDQVI